MPCNTVRQRARPNQKYLSMSKIDRQGKLRRKLMKSMFIGGGILGTSHITMDKWLPPVINSVVLPAHALTSDSGVTRYSFVDPNFEIHPSPGAIGAETGMTNVIQKGSSIASQLAEILIPSAHAASAAQSPSAILEMYLEKIAEDQYKFVISLKSEFGDGVILVLFGSGMLEPGDNTINAALCNGDPKGYPVTLELVTEEAALIFVGGEEYTLSAAPGAQAPAKQACSKPG